MEPLLLLIANLFSVRIKYNVHVKNAAGDKNGGDVGLLLVVDYG